MALCHRLSRRRNDGEKDENELLWQRAPGPQDGVQRHSSKLREWRLTASERNHIQDGISPSVSAVSGFNWIMWPGNLHLWRLLLSGESNSDTPVWSTHLGTRLTLQCLRLETAWSLGSLAVQQTSPFATTLWIRRMLNFCFAAISQLQKSCNPLANQAQSL